jgi:ankyrin repeat protein
LEKVTDNPADNDGQTPLNYAAKMGHHEVIKAILEKASDNPANNDGQTPLHLAARGGHLEVVKTIPTEHAMSNSRNLSDERLHDNI